MVLKLQYFELFHSYCVSSLHNVKLHTYYPSRNTGTINSTIKWAEHAARKGDMRNIGTNKILLAQ